MPKEQKGLAPRVAPSIPMHSEPDQTTSLKEEKKKQKQKPENPHDHEQHSWGELSIFLFLLWDPVHKNILEATVKTLCSKMQLLAYV